MKISQISIKNFRLLEDVQLCLEDGATVVVGRNNSGKTSLTELFRRLLDEKTPRFRLADFSLGVHEQFWHTFEAHRNNEDEAIIREKLPAIITTLTVDYEGDTNLGPLAEFIIDLDEQCTSAQVNIRYALAPGKISQLFEGLDEDRHTFFKALKDRVPKYFEATIESEDPNDSTNRKELEPSNLRAVLQFGFINAQRALDDASNKEKAVLGKVFEKLFTAAASDTASTDDQTTAESLKSAVTEIESQIDADFNAQLQNLTPTFDLFGYPGLTDPRLRTETVLKVDQLLSNHTTVGYQGVNGMNLPESYNGLGPRNLIFILLKLFEFFKEFTNKQPTSGIHLIFIEEPEAHLHPQMQNVFIRKLGEIRDLFVARYNDGNPWPVQFVVTTHSSHIANEASFDSMRYFLTQPRETGSAVMKTEAKDLRTGLSDEDDANREFLHKYMTLTRCDLLFADRAILIEGASERLLLPEMIKKSDEGRPENESRLGSQYLSTMEVGGAYAHRFFNLLDFLNLRTLVITDLDTVDGNNNRTKCKVSQGTHTSNACINSWYIADGQANPTKDDLLAKTEIDKIKANRRLAYQIPHADGEACGRSFEDAFMLANLEKFEITGTTPDESETQAWELAKTVDKTDFAIKYAIMDSGWITPLYIEEGLRWLAGSPNVEEEAAGKNAASDEHVES